jgi:hypothetical protein
LFDIDHGGDRLWYRNDVSGDLNFEITLKFEDITDLEFRFFGNGVEVNINFISLTLV